MMHYTGKMLLSHMQTAKVRMSVRILAVWSGHWVVDIYYNIYWFCKQVMKALIILQKLLIFFQQKLQHICIALDVNFNESLTNNVVSFEQLGPVLCAHTFSSYWQLHFLNQWNGMNGHRNDFRIYLLERYVAELRFELVTPGSADRRVTHCLTEPSSSPLCHSSMLKGYHSR